MNFITSLGEHFRSTLSRLSREPNADALMEMLLTYERALPSDRAIMDFTLEAVTGVTLHDLIVSEVQRLIDAAKQNKPFGHPQFYNDFPGLPPRASVFRSHIPPMAPT